MPELPEVETTKQGLLPHLANQTIEHVIVRQSKLRYPVPQNLAQLLSSQQITNISRRSKYLIFQLRNGALIVHLGMSGHLRLDSQNTLPRKHDHIELRLSNQLILRYHDPRRFGLWLFTEQAPLQHPLLSHLGPEPLTEAFNSTYLYIKAQGKKQCIKSFIMDNKIVVGVGNIYAAESLFHSGIHPMTAARTLSKKHIDRLTHSIKNILQQAIAVGGTTLKDFFASDGSPGYFALKLKVYGREGDLCEQCQSKIEQVKIAGRQSAFCPTCQLA